eukprot:gene9656-11348_t
MPGWKFDLNRPKGQNVAVYENIPGPISLDTNFNLEVDEASMTMSAEMQLAARQRQVQALSYSPGQSLLTTAFMLWMSGTSIQIFSIMMTGMALINPLKAIGTMNQTFKPFEKEEGINLYIPQLIYLSLQLLAFGVAVYKCSTMGLLPLTSSDWYTAFALERLSVLNTSTSSHNHLSAAVNTWTKTSASNYNWHGIASDSTGRYLVTCSNNLKGVYISSSYGVSWSQTSAPTTFDYTGVASSSSGAKLVAVIGGAVAGGIYVSPDTGETWVQSGATSQAWNSVTCDSTCTNIVAVVYSSILSSGGIYFSTTSGVSFTESNAPVENWNGVASDSTGQYVVAVIYNTVLGGGGIYRSTTYGATWGQVSQLAYDWTGIASDSTGARLVAVSSGGTIAISTDSGTTWQLADVPAYNYNCVSSDSTGMFLNVGIDSTVTSGSNGGIYRSTDGGNTWTLSDAPSEAYMGISSDSTGSYVFAASTNNGIWGVVYTETDNSPTAMPSVGPTEVPTIEITGSPSVEASASPSVTPSEAPSPTPSITPTNVPSLAPTETPTDSPSMVPSFALTEAPTVESTTAPTPVFTATPSTLPSATPSAPPTEQPSVVPSFVPSAQPSVQPSSAPSSAPSTQPNAAPSSVPTRSPVSTPKPSAEPTAAPTAPTPSPSMIPSLLPTQNPSAIPTAEPSIAVSAAPTFPTTAVPTVRPSVAPTHRPTASPSRNDTSTLILSFTTNVTLVNLASSVFDQASQTSLIVTNAEIMHIAVTDVTFVDAVALSTSVESVRLIQESAALDEKRSLRRVDAPLATYSAVAVMLTEVAMASTVFPSPEALYQSLTTALSASMRDGLYNQVLANSAVVYGASQLMNAAATNVSSSPEVVSQVSTAPSARPTSGPGTSTSNNHSDEELQVILEVVSIIPGILLMLVGAFTIRFRRPRESTLNQLKILPAEYGHLFIRGVTLVLSVNLLLTSSLTITDPTFVLLLVSRLFILALCVVFFVFFVFPAKEELNSVTGTSLLIRTDVLQDNGAVSVYSVVIVMGLFDISMLRYLPWFRTGFTAVMDGYPNILLVRCSLYGTFFSSLIQTAGILPSLIDPSDTSTKTAIKVIALLVFNLINIVRSFMSIILHMKKVKDIDFKLAIVSENDVAALADFVNSTEKSARISKDSRAPIAPDKVSDMLSVARSTSIRSQADSTASTLNVHNLDSLHRPDAESIHTDNPLHSTFREEDAMSEMTEDVDMDDRGILFATKIHFADETVNILRDQVRLAGLRPLEFIPLPQLKLELEKLFACANSGTPYDTDRLDYLLMCLDHNPEYKAEQEAANCAWRAEIEPFLADSLSILQAFVPPNIFKCTENGLVKDHGYSKALAKRIIVKKCLWLVRISTTDIDRMHIAELNGRFNPEAQNLDIVEAAAIYAVLPAHFSLDGDRRKMRWRASIEENLKSLYKQYQAGTLSGPRKRNPAYKDQVPAFDGRETMHEMSATSNENAFAPRTSFMHMSLPRGGLTIGAQQEGTPTSSANSVTSAQSGSYVQQMSQSLSRELFQKPRTPTSGGYKPGDIVGTNRSSLTMLPSAVNSPAVSERKAGASKPSTHTRSSNFGSELTKALGGRKQASFKKDADDDIL